MTAALSHRLFVAQGILAFVLASPAVRAEEGDLPGGPNVHFRGSLDNARLQFQRRHEGHVAFMGGSITEMDGYRPLVCEMLKQRFPQTQFTFTDAGISSTCSTTGAFRLADVFARARGPVLHRVRRQRRPGRRARPPRVHPRHGRHHPPGPAPQPQMDIVITYFVNPAMLETIQAGKSPLTIASHERWPGITPSRPSTWPRKWRSASPRAADLGEVRRRASGPLRKRDLHGMIDALSPGVEQAFGERFPSAA